MKSLHYILIVSLLSVAAVSAQNQTPTTDSASAVAESKDTAGKRGPIFRASKDQIAAAQSMLKTKGVYTGEATGKLDPATRDSIKSYQADNGLRSTGTLNRATLEKMGIELTEKQKAIPASANSYASADAPKARKTRSASSAADGEKPKRSIFRATKEQVTEAQKLLKTRGMGEFFSLER